MKVPSIVERAHKMKDENTAERERLKRERDEAAMGNVYSP